MSTSIHNHDMYSFLDGYGTPKEMLDRAKEIGLKGFAITNHGNQYSWVYYDKIKDDYPEIKIMYGVEFYEAFDKKKRDKESKYFHLIVLAKNERGRIGINNLVTVGNEEGMYYKPRIELSDLLPYANDVVVSSACLGSKIAKAKSYDDMKKYALEYKKIFPHFFLEMQAHKNEDQVRYNKIILKLSRELDIPYIITTDSHRAKKEELEYQKIMTAIAKDSQAFGEIYDDCYMKSDEEIFNAMLDYMSKEEIQLGLDNSDTIIEIVEDVSMPFKEPELPHFELPEGFETEDQYMMNLCMDGWNDRGFNNLDYKNKKIRKDRLKYEYSVISNMGFSGYFLIVWDFVNFAKENNIAVGAGRGSAAGSLIAYLLGITDIDPVTHGLIFERFLNPERISYPDIDIDVSDRESVIKYLEQKYGKHAVCQVSNFSYITPKVALKDTARAMREDGRLKISHKEVESIAKLFMEEDFEECINSTSKLRNLKDKYKEWFSMAKRISGRVRHASIHACALGIVNTEINNYLGMTMGDSGERVIQVDKRILEEIGIVKMDLLGVTTLTVVQDTLNLIGKDKSIINPNTDEFLNDKKTFELLQKADTVGIFQVESYGMQDLLRRLVPENIGDVSAVLALYRPDSMDMIEDYIERKHGRKEIEYIHDDMIGILKSDYGCMIYQEQLLEIVRKFGGRSYGGADLFRKGIGKKDKDLVKKEADKLYEEIMNTGYDESLARHISDEMSEKGGYSFNKSHSLGYAVLTMQTAYLKANYPLEFMTSLLNSCLSMKDGKYKIKYKKLAKYILDTKNRNINVTPPSMNLAIERFSINNNNIVFGLMLVKDVGQSIVPKILSERNKSEFKSFGDFYQRVEPTKSETVALIKAGAFCDESKKMSLMKHYAKRIYEPTKFIPVKSAPSPSKLLEACGIEISNSEENYKQKRIDVYNEYKLNEYNMKEKERYEKHVKEFRQKYGKNKDFWEYSYLSMFLTHNPLEKYEKMLKSIEDANIGDACTVVGAISAIDKKTNKNKAQYAFVDFYSCGKMIELISWHDSYKEYADMIKKGNIVVVLGKKTDDDKITLERMKPLSIWKKEKGIK